ncbi:MAG: 3-deoxy-D-manno-octulosonic acid transferase [Ilyomonas sp.]
MQKLIYSIFIQLYVLSARLIAPFNEKAALWLKGRKNIFSKLQDVFSKNTFPVVWVHCASLGEFEQGRPVIEKLRLLYPEHKILLTFFSPSGYEVRKNYEKADWIFYLPFDTKKNAKKFLVIVNPSLILFVKYEFWYNYLTISKQKQIPLLLISGIFRKDQPFFKWYGDLHREMLRCFTHLFVQTEDAALLLRSIQINNISISGDTRFDRVSEIVSQFHPIEKIENFCNGRTTIVAGSTWTEDDEELDHFVNTRPDIRFIIAPHDISKERLQECRNLYKQSILFSEYDMNENNSANTLIIDNIGMLSKLYNYATICYIGGAFGSDGVHNVLEAAVYNKPVVFGPVYEKYVEAAELIEVGGAFSIANALELEELFNELLQNETFYSQASNAAGNYVKNKTGATEKIVAYIQAKRLLTSLSKK